MKKTVFICDRCGKEFDRDRLLNETSRSGGVCYITAVDPFGGGKRIDLCEKCLTEFKVYLYHNN